MALRINSVAIFRNRIDPYPADARCMVRTRLGRRNWQTKEGCVFPHCAGLYFGVGLLACEICLLMSWALWGGLVAIVGFVWIYKGEVEVGMEGRPPAFAFHEP